MFRQAFWCARCLVPHSSQTKYYSFFIDRYGTYTLITSVDNTGTNDRVLREVSMYLYFWREEGLPRLFLPSSASTLYLSIASSVLYHRPPRLTASMRPWRASQLRYSSG